LKVEEQGIPAENFLTATMLKVHLCGPLHLHGPLFRRGPFRLCMTLLHLYRAFIYLSPCAPPRLGRSGLVYTGSAPKPALDAPLWYQCTVCVWQCSRSSAHMVPRCYCVVVARQFQFPSVRRSTVSSINTVTRPAL